MHSIYSRCSILAQNAKSHASLRQAIITATKLWELINSEIPSWDAMKDIGIRCDSHSESAEKQDWLHANLPLKVSGITYIAYLQNGCDSAEKHGFKDNIRLNPTGSYDFTLTIPTSFYNTSEGIRQCCMAILDALSEIHLHDISTTTREGIPYQRANSIVASLWYCLVESFRGGRLTRCKVCGLPIITNSERGKVPDYCSAGCKKKAQRQREREGHAL